MSDHKSTRMLSEVLSEQLESGDPTRTSKLLSRIGAALGDSLGRYHEWSSLPAQAELRAQFSENTASKKDTLVLRYRLARNTVSRFELERDWMDDMVKEGFRDADEGGSVIAMADFWFSEFSRNDCSR